MRNHRGHALFLALLGFIMANATAQQPVDFPASARSADIGAVHLPGSETIGEPIEMVASGADIWGEADSFRFLQIPWHGDVDVTVKVLSVENTHPWAKAGVMFRKDLGEGAQHAFIALTPEQGVAFIRRKQNGGPSVDDSHQAMRMLNSKGQGVFQRRAEAGSDGSVMDVPQPRWLRLVKRGSTITAFDSADGIQWEWLGTDTVELGDSYRVGLALSSHDAARSCRAVFSDWHMKVPDGEGSAELQWSGSGQGLKGDYYAGPISGQPVLSRVDGEIDFSWELDSPAEGVPANEFSVRWEGELEAAASGIHALHLISDDRAKLWINGKLVIDEWAEHPLSQSSALVDLEQGKRYLIRIDYFEHRGAATARLLWSGPGLARHTLPASQLFAEASDRDGDGMPDLWEQSFEFNPDDPTDATSDANGDGQSNLEAYFHGRDPHHAVRMVNEEGWWSTDIGQVGLEGSAQKEGEDWIIHGAGEDVWANGDSFHYVYREATGEFEFITRLDAQANTHPWAKAGIMVRTDLGPESSHVALALTPENGSLLATRPQKHSPTGADFGPSVQWLKLEVRRDRMVGYGSEDGINWIWIGTSALERGNEVLAGYFVCSHDNGMLGSARFMESSFRPLAPALQSATSSSSDQGDGLRGTYFDSASANWIDRIDPQVNFDWGTGAPATGVGSDHFSVRWEGWIEAPSDGSYALHVFTDDGARLWLDEQLMIDTWKDQGAEQATLCIPMEAGRKHAIRMEYFERKGEAIARLLWSSPSIPKQPIPQSQLYSFEPEGFPPDTAGSSGSPSPGSGSDFPDGFTPGSTVLRGVELLVNETVRKELEEKITGVEQVAEVAGSQAAAMLGAWKAEGQSIHALDRRGFVEYELSVPVGDVYQLEIEGTSRNKHDLDHGFYLVISVDGAHLGRKLLDASLDRPGMVRLFTPWLQAGQHRVRIYWDNARKGRSLELTQLRLQELKGPDVDGNGRKDWVELWLRETNGVEGKDQETTVLRSATSPICLEGRGRFLSLFEILNSHGESIRAKPGPGERWYANVPLSPDVTTALDLSYENGGLVERCTVLWEPTHVLDAEDRSIRVGDALLLRCAPEGNGSYTGGKARIEVNGEVLHLGDGSQDVVYRFDRTGTYEIKGSFTDPQGRTFQNRFQVDAVALSLGEEPAALVGKPRFWESPNLSSQGAVLQADPRLQVRQTDSQTADRERFSLVIDEAEPRSMVARLGEGGPILDGIQVHGFRFFSGSETDFEIVDRYEEGTELIEMGLVLSPVLPDITVEIKLIVGGVVFEDGTVIKRWIPEDFNPLGEGKARFLRPELAKTSVCHRIAVWQGAVLLNDY